MLGHAKLETTQFYTQVAIDKLKQIRTATHPGASLKPPSELGGPGEAPGEGIKSEP